MLCRESGIVVCCRDRAGRLSGIDKLGHCTGTALALSAQSRPIVSQCRTTNQDPHVDTGVTLFTSTSLLLLLSQGQSCRRLGYIVLLHSKFPESLHSRRVASSLKVELEIVQSRGGKSNNTASKPHTTCSSTFSLSHQMAGHKRDSQLPSLDKLHNSSAPIAPNSHF